ncbi:MAG: glycine cleavage system protein GcvH [Streptosporangiales bacterium]|nr:glycine cleavage system protein GcvH [Streptosporangiales bacterium]
MYPEELSYTTEHEWVRVADDPAVIRVGITHYAQDALGDVVYVSLPEIGTEVEAGQPLGEVESTKSVSDIYAPVTGAVEARNEELDDQPDLVNSDPYGDGWMIDIRVADLDGLDETLAGLLDAAAYQAMVEKE